MFPSFALGPGSVLQVLPKLAADLPRSLKSSELVALLCVLSRGRRVPEDGKMSLKRLSSMSGFESNISQGIARGLAQASLQEGGGDSQGASPRDGTLPSSTSHESDRGPRQEAQRAMGQGRWVKFTTMSVSGIVKSCTCIVRDGSVLMYTSEVRQCGRFCSRSTSAGARVKKSKPSKSLR